MAEATATAEGGRMTLVEHLRELRNRVFKSVLTIVVAMVVSWFFYDQLLDLIIRPYEEADASGARAAADQKLFLPTITAPLTLQLKICGLAGFVLASPVWLYQVWAFVMPGLHRNERKWTLVFATVAGPLFMAGVALGYLVLPKGIDMLLSFTGENIANFIDVQSYLSFVIRMMLAFGIAFEIPLFVVLLNLAGVISGAQLANMRRWIILLAFVFAAVATPSADPFSMLALAIPMTLLFLASEVIAHLVDKRRARRGGYAGVDDDEASPLEYADDTDDDRPSSLMEPD
jgi:sec-independent protein translocase protein TatC